ncbi:hypothetical protein AJ887_03120 [Campylobacter sp. BCW_6466]|nr:hypothetical protein AJ887_03120 [Campylobacter sp. BCW_6466]OEW56304.1 hypothetical protein AJM78_04085 [Campylobacter jejuni]OEW90529.1 hypothetical protein A0M36_07795 [Campylobacter jejuni]
MLKIPYFSFLKLDFEIYHLNTSKNFYGFFILYFSFLSLNLYINFQKVTKKIYKKIIKLKK